jgi:GNAT superfamily N-acetyltransferase
MKIVTVQSNEQLEMIRNLFREYEQFLQVDLCFQGFEAELAGLPGRYAPPEGALLMAMVDGAAAGCVAMRKLESGVCEMKRLYVRPLYQGLGIGRSLAITVIEKAKIAGYDTMRLDTLDKLKTAIKLYVDIGFKECIPYYKNPLPGVVYWELDLMV